MLVDDFQYLKSQSLCKSFFYRKTSMIRFLSDETKTRPQTVYNHFWYVELERFVVFGMHKQLFIRVQSMNMTSTNPSGISNKSSVCSAGGIADGPNNRRWWDLHANLSCGVLLYVRVYAWVRSGLS